MRIRLVALLTILSIACLPMQSYAAKGGEKGPSDRAYERASDNASFKREGGKAEKAEHRRDNDSDRGHEDDSDDRKSRKKDDDDKSDSDSDDSDSDVKPRDKKGKKDKK